MSVSLDEFLRNRLLATLAPEKAEEFRAKFELVSLARYDFLERPKTETTHVYYPISGLGSVVTVGSRARDQRAETSIFGREGMSGTSVVLGIEQSLHEVYMQIPGQALRVPTDTLREMMDDHPPFRDLLLKYIYVQQSQTAFTALANGLDRLQTRLARWLLMAHDRVDGDVLQLTHEFLSLMLGVRRAGVTVAMQALERIGLIHGIRGAVTVLDRDGLVEIANGAYGTSEAEYERLIGVPI